MFFGERVIKLKKIKILDCTLRDGGYINEWHFGFENIKKIINKLNQSNIDIIECGFLRDDDIETSKDYSNYKSFEDLINADKDLFKTNKEYTLMMLAEKYDTKNLVNKNQNYINTIRLAFHKRDMKKAIKMAKEIQEKGYNLFLQPTATMRYTDDEIIELIKICNEEIKPKSLAIVDTFGEMISDNIIHYTKLFDEYLDENISLSFHSHNNLQTAYSNAILFIENVKKEREIVIDSSIYGMGRGAGNLCTELIVDYMNKKFEKKYNLFPLLEVVDNILSDIKKTNYWGYSLEYYLSAINHCHPNYCIYFSNKKTLTTHDLAKIVELISENKRIDFDKDYAEELYYSYNNKTINDEASYKKLKKIIDNRKILLLGPGQSIKNNLKEIKALIDKKEEYFSISINNNLELNEEAYFFSNKKRYNDNNIIKNKYYIFTSNIADIKVDDTKKIVFNYQQILAKEYDISDNALLLALNLLKNMKINKVFLAGFDGFKQEQVENFYDDKLLYLIDKNKINELNDTLTKYINLYKKDIDIEFITKSIYEK